MYSGIKPKKKEFKYTMPTKAQMLQMEEVEVNGVITTRFVIKTKDFSTDERIHVRDFDICNAKANGTFDSLQNVTLTPTIDKVEANAATADAVLHQITIIKALEDEQQSKTQNDN